MLETTTLCQEITGNEVKILASGTERPGDVPVYLSDCRALHAHTTWRAQRTPKDVITDITAWIRAHESLVASALG